MFSFIRFTSAWFTLSGLAVVISLAAIVFFGLNLGIDFTGGSLMEVRFDAPTSSEKISNVLNNISELKLGNPVVVPVDKGGKYLLRFRYLDESEQDILTSKLKQNIGGFELERLTTVGPTIGNSLREKSIRALSYAAIAIILYIAATFRNRRKDSLTKYIFVGTLIAGAAIVVEVMVESDLVRWATFAGTILFFMGFLIFELSRNNPSLKYGVCAILALLHDIIITLGVFAILGYFLGVEVDALFVTALLTIMGFSVHDTIVVFDRLRENLKHHAGEETFSKVADRSLHQTLARSINTSFTTLITLTALFILGADSIHWFIGALIVGIFVGTYSSIFTATPLLVAWQKSINN